MHSSSYFIWYRCWWIFSCIFFWSIIWWIVYLSVYHSSNYPPPFFYPVNFLFRHFPVFYIAYVHSHFRIWFLFERGVKETSCFQGSIGAKKQSDSGDPKPGTIDIIWYLGHVGSNNIGQWLLLIYNLTPLNFGPLKFWYRGQGSNRMF